MWLVEWFYSFRLCLLILQPLFFQLIQCKSDVTNVTMSLALTHRSIGQSLPAPHVAARPAVRSFPLLVSVGSVGIDRGKRCDFSRRVCSNGRGGALLKYPLLVFRVSVPSLLAILS